MATKHLNVRLPEETIERLEILSKETGRTKTYYIQELLNDNLDKMEEIYLHQKVEEDKRRKALEK